MTEFMFERNLKALQTFYPQAEGAPHHLKIEEIKGLPLWVRGAIDVFELPLQVKPRVRLYLVLPRAEMDFEQLIRIYKQLLEKLHAHILIVADNLPPKHRPLLVKFRIPFIYKDEAIFAPELGLKISNLKALEVEPKLELQNKKEGLTPFAIKILAGLLTKQIPQEFNLKFLHENLEKKGLKVSLAKLSPTLSELAANGLLLIHGSGPRKAYTNSTVQILWQKILALKLAPYFREMQVNYIPKDRHAYVIAGESALAHYSNLNAPSNTTIAMSVGQFRAVFEQKKETIPYGDFGNPSSVQIWKEDPRVFSIDGVINPVELFLSMRDHSDERVQMGLDELLSPYGLARK